MDLPNGNLAGKPNHKAMFLKALVLFLLGVTCKTKPVSNIPKRFENDWRLFCNVCSNFIRTLDKDLEEAVKRDGELGWESKVGFRLDSHGKKKHKATVEARRNEITIIESLEKGLCDEMKAHAVLYDKTLKDKPAERMLQEREKYDKTVKQGFSKKQRYVNMANLYCAEINHRYYDEVVEAFTKEDEHARDSFCKDNVDTRCGLMSELPKLKFKKVKKPKNETAKWKPKPNSEDGMFQEGFLAYLIEWVRRAVVSLISLLRYSLSWLGGLWQADKPTPKGDL